MKIYKSVSYAAMAIFGIAVVGSASANTIAMSTPVSGGGTLSWTDVHSTVFTVCPSGKFNLDKRISSGFSFSGGTITNSNITASAQVVCGNALYQATPSTLAFTLSNGCQITFDVQSETAVGSCEPTPINPKYEVIGVTYAPPGPQSYVQYTTSNMLSTALSYDSSFSNSSAFSTSLSYGFKIGGIVGSSVTGSYSSTWTTTNSTSTGLTIQQQSNYAYKLPGVPTASSPVNHDYDVIWLWLNPVELYTINTKLNTIQFNGLGYDTADQPDLDVYPVYVGTLNGHFAMTAADQTALGRSWASSQYFADGSGPGLTTSDFTTILTADPFTNPNYSFLLNTGVTPATTTDKRFSISTGASNNFVYKPGSPIVTLTNSYSDASVTGQGSSYKTERTFGVASTLKGSGVLLDFTLDLKSSNTLSSTHSENIKTTTTNQTIDSLSISPPCAAVQCTPPYTGYSQFDVYQDNIFGAFMFYPVR